MNTEIYQLKRNMSINEVIGIIDNNSLSNDIIKYIAPKFSLSKKNKKNKKKLAVKYNDATMFIDD